MRDQHKDPERLAHILEAIDNVYAFMHDKTAEDFQEDKLIFNDYLSGFLVVIKNNELIKKLFSSRFGDGK